MNVQTINPFAKGIDESANAATQSTGEAGDAAGAFAALLANIVSGVQTAEELEAGAAPAMVVEEGEVDADDVKSEDADEAPSDNTPWLPEGMVSVAQAPLLVAHVAPVEVESVIVVAGGTESIELSLADDAAKLAASQAALSESADGEAPALAGASTVAPQTDSAETKPTSTALMPAPTLVQAEGAPVEVMPAEADTEPEVAVTAKAVPVAASSTPEAEATVPVASSPREVVEALLAKAAVVNTQETAKSAEALQVERTSKKAQLRELAAISAAKAATTESVSGTTQEAVEAVPALAKSAESSEARVVLGALLVDERSAGETETSEESGAGSVRSTPSAESASRPAGPVFARELSVASPGTAASQAAPVEVPVAELPKMTESSIKQLLDSGEQRMSIRIKPDNLGEMQIEVTRAGGDVQVRLTAATQAVRELLDSHAPQLREALAREGFDGARIQVSPPSSSSGLNLGHAGAGQQGNNSAQQQQHSTQPHWSGARAGSPVAPAAVPSASILARATGGGVALNITI